MVVAVIATTTILPGVKAGVNPADNPPMLEGVLLVAVPLAVVVVVLLLLGFDKG